MVRIHRSFAPICLALLFAATGTHARTPATPALAEAKPEAVGFASERLKPLHETLQAHVDNKQLAGLVTILARHGKIVDHKTYGLQDIAGNKPMQKDTIFRIYSMTKPIVGAAMMMLYEEGKWKPSDPLSRFIPELANLKVYAGEKDGKPVLEAPKHAPTVGELMSHTAGFTYGLFGNSPVDKMYMQANPLAAGSLKEFIDKLASLPLAYQPGESWVYSVSVDVQGYLVEKISGKSLPEFLEERLFKPLGMKDTAFFVPELKLPRLASVYVPGPQGQGLMALPHDPSVSKLPGFASGGGGLYSTADDYLRFAQMLLNGGELNGTRLLAPSTIELMRANHVPAAVKNGKFGIGYYRMQPGFGFGYDVAVYEDPAQVGSTVGKGTYLWDGAAGTWFWIDPANDVIFIGMVQRMMTVPGMPNLEDTTRALTYRALVDPDK
jgi:CubicO group peptidase (beta-lactamase class C family)